MQAQSSVSDDDALDLNEIEREIQIRPSFLPVQSLTPTLKVDREIHHLNSMAPPQIDPLVPGSALSFNQPDHTPLTPRKNSTMIVNMLQHNPGFSLESQGESSPDPELESKVTMKNINRLQLKLQNATRKIQKQKEKDHWGEIIAQR